MAGITDKEVRGLLSLAVRECKPKAKVDGTIPGLTFTASRAGLGAWVLRYYAHDGKRKETTIGQYPAWGIKEAREKAKELRREVDMGVDVATEKQRARRDALSVFTVDGLADAYFAMAEKDLHPHTFNQRRSLHDRFVSPLIGGMDAGKVKAADVVDVVRKSEGGGKSLPNITLTHCSLIFSHAVGNGIRDMNPCRDLKLSAIVGKQDAPKQRVVLTASDLSLLLPALADIPKPYALAVRLLLLTGVRIGQLSEAKTKEFDLTAGLWSIPHERRKNRRHTSGPFVIPLPDRAIGWVRELIQLADRSEYLLPVETRRHTDNRNRMSKRTTIAGWLDRLRTERGNAWPRFTPHDLRATCKSWLSALRVDYETRQRYLDHAPQGMDAIYDKETLLSQRRAAADVWLGFMDGCESGRESEKVVRLHGVA